MLTNIAPIKSALRITTLALVALSFLQVPVAEARETTVVGESALLGLARGEALRFTAFNPIATDSGERNEPISLRLRLYDAHGNVIAESGSVDIPPGEFRFIDINYGDLPPTAAPASRNQFLTTALWGVRSASLITVITSLDILDGDTGQTRVSTNRWLKLASVPPTP